MNPDKPFYLTSEFYKSLVPLVLAVLLSTGVIKPGDTGTIQGELMNMITAAFSLAASAYTIGHYIRSRTDLKVATIQKNESVAIANAGNNPKVAKAALPLALICLLLLPGLASAQPPRPGQQSTSYCLGWFRNRNQQQRTDPAVLAILNQLVGISQQNANTSAQILALLQAQLQAQHTTPTSAAPPAASAAPPVVIFPPTLQQPVVSTTGGVQPNTSSPYGVQPNTAAPYNVQPNTSTPYNVQPNKEAPYAPPPNAVAPYVVAPVIVPPYPVAPNVSPPYQPPAPSTTSPTSVAPNAAAPAISPSTGSPLTPTTGVPTLTPSPKPPPILPSTMPPASGYYAWRPKTSH
jgi:hypothetical protein